MICKLYWYAEKTIGNQASYTDLANCMNKKAMVNPESPQTKSNTTTVWCWFKQQGDKEKSPKEKPYPTENQKKECRKWCDDEKLQMAEH